MDIILYFLGGIIFGAMITIIFAYTEGFQDGYKKGRMKINKGE